jgi:Kdo2-lipid IVA lauroyltransferase/acyltransferase
MQLMARDRRPLHHFLAPRWWPWWLGLGLLRVSVALPYRLQMALGRAAGRIAHRMLAARRFVARRNIEICFPELDPGARDALVRRHFEALGCGVLEMAMAWWGRPARLDALVTLEGLEHLEAALAHGRGAILFSAHFTPLEMSGRHLTARYEVDAMYRPSPENPLMNEILRRGRERTARRTIAKDDVRAMLKSLRANVPVWYAPDQSYRRKYSAPVTFFGEHAMTNTATSRLSALSGAPVLPFFIRRIGAAGGYVATIQPPLEDFPGDDPVADTERLNRAIEAQVRLAPEQYYWVHRKFKARPDPWPDPYASPETSGDAASR